MKFKLLFCILAAVPFLSWGQSHEDTLFNFREDYINSLIAGKPGLTSEEASYLRFYKVDKDYRVNAVFVPLTSTRPFPIETEHGGTSPSVRTYGYVYCKVKGAAIKLYVLQFLQELENKGKTLLFIPFTDATNYKETFRGGRYLDISVNDIKDNGFVIIDFNKCYNPYTAYKKGYPYLVPPDENDLDIEIRAGEEIFAHNPGY